MANTTPSEVTFHVPTTLRDLERRAILATLVYYRWQMTEVSRALGIARSALYAKIKRYEIPRPSNLGQMDAMEGPKCICPIYQAICPVHGKIPNGPPQ